MSVEEAVIVDVVRTPSGRGKPGGALSGKHSVDLLGDLLAELVRRNDLDPGTVDDVIAGCVAQVGQQSYNVARNAVLAAGFPEHVPATTIDRQCGSSQQAAHFAAQAVMAGVQDVVIACGVESMSTIPMGTSTLGRDPYGERIAARYPDGLVGQGVSAELIAQKYGFGRDELDEFSARSHRLAAEAAEAGEFDRELVPVEVVDAAGGSSIVTADETVRPATTAEGLSGLNPSFRTDALAARFPELDWKITPGNSSPLTDGASAALIMSARRAEQLGLTPRARFHAFAVTGSDPLYMLTGVMPATARILKQTGLNLDDIDAYEVNEAFAPVPLAWLKEFGADPERLNGDGGAIALGHPLGASGTRLLGTLLARLERTGGRYGLQTMCEGGGMANATIIERL
ncbi:thiolase family protein [Humibacter ginsenosidimutans]|uniref:Thiolase family protein n=1 Tax=Humibacter ginsenosidimutans TaxID=2599293 RepID=A0A5B8M9L2_9MICO|nr:thiolase family protein [Humibacter ginsenosidimutans]QDZ16365.1 thiolase family protein [Humibacter ginsenosidimutans]